ncbi:nucleocapsid protein [J virus]|uniref:Nucleocapsid n=1 Tax=J virus TaxID=322067 RepID=Q49HP2_9MONO|nr:nucleocapsid protein [J virus]AAX86025.1 nucleocapsid protein [J virus]
MSKLNKVLDEFRDFKNNPPKKVGPVTALQGFKKNVVVPVPMMKDTVKRFHFITFCLQLVWSDLSSGAFITGAFLALLSIFAENPAAMLRSLLNDPDIDVQLAEIADIDNDKLKLATRGKEMSRYENDMMRMASAGPSKGASPYPYVRQEYQELCPKSTEELQLCVQSITTQLWILLTKAVTAIDTARDSEKKRWGKFLQQRRALEEYQLVDAWLDRARVRVASDLAIRRYMITILLETGKMTGPKPRVVELIADIGNYISETGMAGFFLTIKYGIETKYPVLAMSEFAADLATVLSLMKMYTTLGEKAPYMVILEESIQTKFAPGNYPILWSYAMGVASVLDRSVSNLNYTRPYLENAFFRLGESMVQNMGFTVNKAVAEDLGFSEEQVAAVREILKSENANMSNGPQGPKANQSSTKSLDIKNADSIIPESDDETDAPEDVKARLDAEKEASRKKREASMRKRQSKQDKSRADSTIRDIEDELNDIISKTKNLSSKPKGSSNTTDTPKQSDEMSDLSAING